MRRKKAATFKLSPPSARDRWVEQPALQSVYSGAKPCPPLRAYGGSRAIGVSAELLSGTLVLGKPPALPDLRCNPTGYAWLPGSSPGAHGLTMVAKVANGHRAFALPWVKDIGSTSAEGDMSKISVDLLAAIEQGYTPYHIKGQSSMRWYELQAGLAPSQPGHIRPMPYAYLSV